MAVRGRIAGVPGISMYMSYGGKARPEVRADSTFDAIIGDWRKATTRWPKNYNYPGGEEALQQLKNLQPGQPIQFWDQRELKNADRIITVETTPAKLSLDQGLNGVTYKLGLHQLIENPKLLERASQLEGWSKDAYIDFLRRYGYGYQFQYQKPDDFRVNYNHTPEIITDLQPEEVFVFGSNTEGRHGAGAAKQAMNFGAEYGNPVGPQGNTYAIRTKYLAKGRRSLPLEAIHQDLNDFMDYAEANQDKTFLVSPIGTGLAGYSAKEMAQPFAQRYGRDLPGNLILPRSFHDLLSIAQDKRQKQMQPNPLADLAPLNPRVAQRMKKDIEMANHATQFLGKSTTTHIPSSTANYMQAWGDRANTGNYTPDDVVMVSGNGPWRGVTDQMIQQTFDSHYLPNLEKGVQARSKFVAGRAKGTDSLVGQYLRSQGYQVEPRSEYDYYYPQ